jgi:DnaJ-class molecular chaperone
MAERSYYEVLGVAQSASAAEIKKAYRNLARKLHPDVNPGDKAAEKKFQELQQAYDVLSDADKRAHYDRVGHAAFESGLGAGFGPRAGAADWAAKQAGPENFETIDFGQFFGQGGAGQGGGIFDEILSKVGGGRTRRGPRIGRTLETHLSIPFATAIQGGETTIELEREGGKRETLVVKIPPGVEPGAKLRLKGRGEPGERNAPAGDLVIQVDVEPHPTFRREGRDLVVEVPVTIEEATLGAKIDVPSLAGAKTLSIPAGTSSGQRLRLRGLGVPSANDRPEGDLFVLIRIVVPRSLDADSQRLLREFASRNPQRPRAGLW